MLERALIDHGSPTLANMKVGSLFTSSCADAAGFRAEFRRVQAALESRGVSLTILRVQQERALVYVYRQEALAALLAQADVQAFLRAMGYGDTSPDGALAFLRQRLAESPCFPHEIGVFLGYPLSDVIAFMRDGGRLPMQRMLEGVHERVRSDARFPALQGVPRGIPDAFPRRMAA